jgi:hypothetical protein
VSLPLHADVLAASGVPYYSQWESAELVPQFLDGSLSAADDPNWATSGARTPAEYAFWASRVCGLACLRMVLDGRGLLVPPMIRLVEQALAWKAYVRDGDRVAGLIYKPFADWVLHDYGISAAVVPDLSLEQVCASASPAAPVIASVHSWIRWPDRTPPQTGGHLVLVTGAAGGVLRLHNPSGLPGASQRDARIRSADFARFFAGRGLIVGGRQLAGLAIPHPDHHPAALARRLGPPFLDPVQPVAEPPGHRGAARVRGVAVDLHPVHAVQRERNRGQGCASRCTVAAACLASGDPVPDLSAAVAQPPVQGNFPDQGSSLRGQHRVRVAETGLPAVISLGNPG